MEQARVFRVLGIDPGTHFVGYGIVEEKGGRLLRIAGGCIAAQGSSIAERLVQIHHELQAVITTYQPREAAVETVFTGNNPKTAIAIGEGRGVALLSAAEQGLPIAGYEPAMVKRAITGSGRAAKEQIRAMVTTLLGLREPPPTEHEADALALAITHLHHARHPLFVQESPWGRRPRSPFRRYRR